MNACRFYWQVDAGILPGHPMPEYSRRFAVDTDEWEAVADPTELLDETTMEALNYARSLADPTRVNWVSSEFVWL